MCVRGVGACGGGWRVWMSVWGGMWVCGCVGVGVRARTRAPGQYGEGARLRVETLTLRAKP